MLPCELSRANWRREVVLIHEPLARPRPLSKRCRRACPVHPPCTSDFLLSCGARRRLRRWPLRILRRSGPGEHQTGAPSWTCTTLRRFAGGYLEAVSVNGAKSGGELRSRPSPELPRAGCLANSSSAPVWLTLHGAEGGVRTHREPKLAGFTDRCPSTGTSSALAGEQGIEPCPDGFGDRHATGTPLPQKFKELQPR